MFQHFNAPRSHAQAAAMLQRFLVPLLLLLLTACSTQPIPTPPALPVATSIPFTEFAMLPAQGSVTTIGYLLLTNDGALLAPAAGFSAPTPQALGTPEQQIWLAGAIEPLLDGNLAMIGGVHHALVLAIGTLDPPGSYGPGGIYPRQLRPTQLIVVSPQEVSIVEARTKRSTTNQRMVRIVGWILLNAGSAVLVDQVGQGGIPQPGATSLKVRLVAEDPALITKLQSTASGSVYYGQVQIEGYLQEGILVPLAIRVVGT